MHPAYHEVDKCHPSSRRLCLSNDTCRALPGTVSTVSTASFDLSCWGFLFVSHRLYPPWSKGSIGVSVVLLPIKGYRCCTPKDALYRKHWLHGIAKGRLLTTSPDIKFGGQVLTKCSVTLGRNVPSQSALEQRGRAQQSTKNKAVPPP